MRANDKFSERLRDTLRRKGYWDLERAAPEVGRFCLDYGYLPSYLYRWLRGEVPRAEKLLVLAKQLEVEPDWLVGVESLHDHATLSLVVAQVNLTRYRSLTSRKYYPLSDCG